MGGLCGISSYILRYGESFIWIEEKGGGTIAFY